MARSKNTAGSGYSILVVDDKPEELDSIKALLETEGYSVFLCQNGSEAVELVRKFNNFDILILDYFMPEITGEEVVEKIRKFNSDIYIILNTGYAGEKPPLQVMKNLNIQAYHDKTEGPDKLLLLIASAVKHCEFIKTIRNQERGLEFILKSSREIFKAQSLIALLGIVLKQLPYLINFENGFVCAKTSIGNYLTDGVGVFKNLGWDEVKNSELKQIILEHGFKSEPYMEANIMLIPLVDSDGGWVGLLGLSGVSCENIAQIIKLINIYGCNIAAAILNIWNIEDIHELWRSS